MTFLFGFERLVTQNLSQPINILPQILPFVNEFLLVFVKKFYFSLLPPNNTNTQSKNLKK